MNIGSNVDRRARRGLCSPAPFRYSSSGVPLPPMVALGLLAIPLVSYCQCSGAFPAQGQGRTPPALAAAVRSHPDDLIGYTDDLFMQPEYHGYTMNSVAKVLDTASGSGPFDVGAIIGPGAWQVWGWVNHHKVVILQKHCIEGAHFNPIDRETFWLHEYALDLSDGSRWLLTGGRQSPPKPSDNNGLAILPHDLLTFVRKVGSDTHQIVKTASGRFSEADASAHGCFLSPKGDLEVCETRESCLVARDPIQPSSDLRPFHPGGQPPCASSFGPQKGLSWAPDGKKLVYFQGDDRRTELKLLLINPLQEDAGWNGAMSGKLHVAAPDQDVAPSDARFGYDSDPSTWTRDSLSVFSEDQTQSNFSVSSSGAGKPALPA